DGLRSTLGPGGPGGSVRNVNITGVRDFVRTVMAGAGGESVAAQGGTGGSVENVRVAGTIGDFSRPFEFSTFGTAGQGGISAGQGGAGATAGRNGSVVTVRADRISAILAGRPPADALTTVNAAWAVSGVRAFFVGADVDEDEEFDFLDAGLGGFGLGDGDTLTDGLVIVRDGGLGLIRTPRTGESIAPFHVEYVA
ncbi:MAG TPA: hypothetical protein VM597_06240, partial [Gemmataceae bacterium]|nr:hypothetical protein [Gemmataceae bacterium]